MADRQIANLTGRTLVLSDVFATQDAAAAAEAGKNTITQLLALIDVKAPQTLTDGATVTWSITAGYNAVVTLGGNRTLDITNAVAGDYGTLKIIQDETGSRTLALPASVSKVISGGAGAVTLTTAAASVDLLSFYYNGTNFYFNIGKNYT